MQTSTGECSFDGCKNIGVCVGYYKHRHHRAFFPDIEPYYQCDIHFGLNHDLSHDPEFFHHLGICSIHDCIERVTFMVLYTYPVGSWHIFTNVRNILVLIGIKKIDFLSIKKLKNKYKEDPLIN